MKKEVYHQYKWDGSDNIVNIFQYSNILGPKHTSLTQINILNLSKNEIEIIHKLQEKYYPQQKWTENKEQQEIQDLQEIEELQKQQEIEENNLKILENQLIHKIDEFLLSLNSLNIKTKKWFLKTNRHSCKDSPLDHPLQNDLLYFSSELDKMKKPIDEDNIDNIDFGPCFLAMCRSRLKSTSITNGNEVLSLLLRSKRIYGDFTLQLQLNPEPWDCYLAFNEFDDEMAEYPLHEFRCYISNRQIRCIMQYSYLITCPIPSNYMNLAIEQISNYLLLEYLPLVPDSIHDIVVDIQCVPIYSSFQNNNNDNNNYNHNDNQLNEIISFNIRFIESNPFGPGTVWGHLDWDNDKNWLLYEQYELANDTTILPSEGCKSDTQGGEKTIFWYKSQQNNDENNCICVVLYTSNHPIGMIWGGLAHIPPEYMLIIWEKWELEGKVPKTNQESEKQINKRENENCLIL